jgi:2-polyprenyl-6-hydroxyphenyl methylase/3-demethylubiquinone-9 3-methyltransferase
MSPADESASGYDQNLDQMEIAKFETAAADWWNPRGVYKSLHDINPLRMKFISDRVDLCGRRVIDVACGVGLVSEAMARAGAEVTGIDMARRVLAAASQHARRSRLPITYRNSTVEQMAVDEPEQYEVVVCMELLEHVPDPASVVAACSRLTRPGGDLFFATLNRTFKSYLFAIIGAEYVLRLLPVGTHRWAQFVKPEEVRRWAAASGLGAADFSGLQYNPFTRQYRLGGNLQVNYLVYFKKPH